MTTYHAFGVQPDDITIHDLELELPQPTGREVLLKVTHAGVCHTDTHLREGGYDLGSMGKMELSARGFQYPIVLGHENVGQVVAVGDAVPLDESPVGSSRLIYPWIGCGDCDQCQAGHDNRCAAGQNLGVARHGGYAEYILVPDYKYLVAIDGLDPSWAATLACSGITAFGAFNKVSHLPKDAPILVCGAGGLGMTAMSIFAHYGYSNVIAVDINDQNLEIARELGAAHTVNSATDVADGDVAAAVKAVAGGPVSAAIDFVNNGATAKACFQSLRKAGLMVQVGLFGGEFIVPNALLALQMIRIEGSFVGNLDDMKNLVKVAQESDLPKMPIQQRPLTADNVAGALDDLVAGGVAGRIILTG